MVKWALPCPLVAEVAHLVSQVLHEGEAAGALLGPQDVGGRVQDDDHGQVAGLAELLLLVAHDDCQGVDQDQRVHPLKLGLLAGAPHHGEGTGLLGYGHQDVVPDQGHLGSESQQIR